MVLIISDKTDISTIEVTRWLRYYKVDFIIIYPDTALELVKLEISNKLISYSICISGKTIKSEEISKIWYRRGELNLKKQEDFNKLLFETGSKDILKHVGIEYDNLIDFFWFCNQNKIALNSYTENYLNKLNVLQIARECKLNIPDTIICDNKDSLRKFAAHHKKIICKSIYNNPCIKIKSTEFFTYNFLIDDNVIDRCPAKFGFSLFQKYIDKLFEIRVFFINDNLYTMAILSQDEKKTQVDFRNYNFENMNRFTSYNPPQQIKDALIMFMKKVDLKSGSIDMIVDTSCNYYFLEVNPIGQFGMISFPCNYYIERKVAQILRLNETN